MTDSDLSTMFRPRSEKVEERLGFIINEMEDETNKNSYGVNAGLNFAVNIGYKWLKAKKKSVKLFHEEKDAALEFLK